MTRPMIPDSDEWERLAAEMAMERVSIVPCHNQDCQRPVFEGCVCRWCDCQQTDQCVEHHCTCSHKIHLTEEPFVGGVTRTKCGRDELAASVTAFRRDTTCGNCKRTK